jgi:enoyl-CoA hydratase
MAYEMVNYERKDGIIVISLNRPQVLNAINGALSRDFLAALKEAEADTETNVVVIRGEGRAFCAGFDLSQSGSPERQVPLEHQRDTGQNITRVMMGMSKIVIAAVHGYAVGAGLEWTMGADLRVVAEGTQFGATETNVGQTVTNAGTKLLTHYIGLAKAKELYFTNEFMDAEEANRLGYVNELVPLDQLESATMEMAKRINENSGLSLMLTKDAVNRSLSMSIEETLQMESRDSQINALVPSQREYGRAAMERLRNKKKG